MRYLIMGAIIQEDLIVAKRPHDEGGRRLIAGREVAIREAARELSRDTRGSLYGSRAAERSKGR